MSIPGSLTPLFNSGGGAGYQVSRSIRLNASDSAYLSRTPASAGNRKTWTWAGWVKRSKFSQNMPIFGTDYNGASYFTLYFTGGNNFAIENYNASYQLRVQTTQLFRDPSAWFHLVVTLDTTQGTASDRCKIYVNGSQVTALDFNTYPSQNADLLINNNQYHEISTTNSTYTFGGYLADIHFIDGQALTPTSFGEFSATTGVWMPKAYAGSYGTNGFKLNFSDNSTAAALGTDTSGNGNTWSVNNLSVTAGAGNDSLVDVPVNGSEVDTGAGGQVRGNYCTLNPLDKGSNVTLTNGNLDVSTNSTWNSVRATFGITSGKWYWEYTMTAAGYTMVGIGSRVIDLAGYIGQSSAGYAYYSLNGNKWNSGSAASYGSSFTTNDVVGVAFDADAGKIWFSKNGTWQASGDPAAGTNAAYTSIPSSTYFPTISQDNSLPASTGGTLNAGARSFAYTAPSGFKALCTANLPAPTIVKPSTVMDVKLYTGNGSTQTISGLGFSPDLVWMKVRSIGYNHTLIDSVRGATKTLSSSMTVQEYTEPTGPTAFTSDGWSMSGDVTYVGSVNANGQTYAGWCWDAGSSTVTNTQGSITSQVRANASAGFSIVTYSGNSTAGATVGHGLGVAPAFVIAKSRNNSSEWMCYHQSLGNAQSIILNTTAAAGGSSGWNSTSPSSTVITLGVSGAGNFSGYTHVIYAFAPVAGYSSFGSYVGNGSSDGVFVYTGFRPAVVIIKSTGVENWFIFDNDRLGYNPDHSYLLPNSSAAETSFSGFDLLSNGFKWRTNSVALNNNGTSYVYAAFAESPFAYSRAR
jgi:hypothetical protein